MSTAMQRSNDGPSTRRSAMLMAAALSAIVSCLALARFCPIGISIAANNLSRTETTISTVTGRSTSTSRQRPAATQRATRRGRNLLGAQCHCVWTYDHHDSQNGLTKTVLADLNGDGTTDREMTDVTVIAADQSKTRTKQTKSASGCPAFRSVEQRAADGLVGTISTDTNGDGVNDLLISVTKDASGFVTETSTVTSADGSLVSRSSKTTFANGLTSVSRLDRFGRNQIDQLVMDVISTQ